MMSLRCLTRGLASLSLKSSSVLTSANSGIVGRWASASSQSFSTLNSVSLAHKGSLLNTVTHSIKSTSATNPESLSICRGFQYYSFKDPLTPYLKRYIDRGPPKKKPKTLGPTEGRPFLKGVVLKTLIKKPKKPNSANRKCVRVRLSTGREATAYVPGIGHNLQEHQTVLVRGGRVQDLPGVKLKCVRGKFDLSHVKKVVA